MDDHFNKSDDRLEAGRECIRASLDEIVTDLRTALRDSGLSYSVDVRVPHSGDSIATLVTPADPPQDDWDKVVAIFLTIIGDRLG
jgi:hypothetical protein